MAIDATKKVKKIMVDGALMPFSSAIDANIQPENIKKDVTILGVTGTLESGGGTSKLPQVVDRSVTELTADDLAGATKISSNTFSSCAGLTSIAIPNSVTRIGSSAFSGCSSLTSIAIPDSVTSIGIDAFAGCSSLTQITILAITPPTLSSADAISTATSTIYVPYGTKSTYENANV